MEQNSQTKTVTTRREDWPLAFRCPEDWQVKELAKTPGIKFSLRGPKDPDGRLFASITVIAWLEDRRTALQLTRQWIETRSSFRTFRLLVRSETTVADMEALQVDAAHDMPLPMMAINPKMVAVQERVIFAAGEGKAYQFTYRAVQDDFENHLPVFQDVLASLSLEGQP
jgi:hypothetical protein